MYEFGLPVLYALLLWWVSTGVLLYLQGLPRRTFPWSMLGMTVVALAALYGHTATSTESSVGAAYLSFTCALLVWAWIELSYYSGLVTGLHTDPCPPDATQWRRFEMAVRTSLYHELAIVATAALLAGLAWEAENQVGTWTFIILWVMRWSAKLNLFLGVPNLNESWLPEHLRFLSSYMPKRPMNLLFPVSVTGATVILGLLVQSASAGEAEPFRSVGLMLVASLLALGILEHWFLVLPISEATLWRWATQGAEEQGAGRTEDESASGQQRDGAPAHPVEERDGRGLRREEAFQLFDCAR
jgi:putative photosynthetic complex assembly protein 2